MANSRVSLGDKPHKLNKWTFKYIAGGRCDSFVVSRPDSQSAEVSSSPGSASITHASVRVGDQTPNLREGEIGVSGQYWSHSTLYYGFMLAPCSD